MKRLPEDQAHQQPAEQRERDWYCDVDDINSNQATQDGRGNPDACGRIFADADHDR